MNNDREWGNTRARLAAKRREARRQSFVRTFSSNPIISLAAGIFIIAGGASSLSNALVISAVAIVLLPLLCVFAAVENHRIEENVRPIAFFLLSAVLVFGISMAINSIFEKSVEAVGVFVPLMSAAAFSMCSDTLSQKNVDVGEAFSQGLSCALCYALLAVPVGFIRELVGSGAVLGNELGFSGIELFLSPGMGFVLCGFLLAAFNAVFCRPDAEKGRGGAHR